jgi:hypothetical protein
MKRAAIAALAALVALSAAAQTAADYAITGDFRLSLPGPDIIDSTYARNPASCSLNIHSSLSFGAIGYPSYSGGVLSVPIGLFTALCLPNFDLVNITAGFSTQEGGREIAVEKNLLGMQFGLSTLDLGAKLPVTAALGLGGYMDAESRDGTESRSFVMDAGASLGYESLLAEILCLNLLSYSPAGGFAFAGPRAEYELRLKTRIILDIFFSAGLSTALSIDPADFILEAQMYRFFFSESLRTGIDIKVFCDAAPSGLVIPGQSYGFTLAYFLPDFARLVDPKQKALATFLSYLNGFALNARTMVTIMNGDGTSTASPVLSLGLSRFF